MIDPAASVKYKSLKSLVLGLRRVYIMGDFPEAYHGNIDRFTTKVAETCRRCPSKEKIHLKFPFMAYTNSKRRREIDPFSPEAICSRYMAYIRRRGLTDKELAVIRNNLSPSSSPFVFYKPIYFEVKTYPFGLVSYRVWTCVLPKVDSSLKDLALEWKSLAVAFTKIIRDNMERDGVKRFSLASQYFSEVSLLFETDLKYSNLIFSTEPIHKLLGLDNILGHFLSPLKLRREFHYEVLEIPQLVYISRDGVVILFLYSLKEKHKGSRRGSHSVRRKIRRRSLGFAADLALGLKVFLENPDIWFNNVEDKWGLLTGLIYLNPGVVETITALLDDKARDLYMGIIKVLELEKPFNGFIGNLYYPSKPDVLERVCALLACFKGGKLSWKEASIGRMPELNNLMVKILELLIMKNRLDFHFPLDEDQVELISRILCSFDLLLESLSRFVESKISGRGESDVVVSLPATDCSTNLKEYIMERHGGVGREGLTRRELKLLLSSRNISTSSMETALESLRREKLIICEKSRKKRKGGVKGRKEVDVFLPNLENGFVRLFDRSLTPLIDKIIEFLELIRKSDPLLKRVFGD